MKKIIYLLLVFCAVSLASCEKEEIGGTATQDMAGQWYVTVDAVDASGNLVLSDDELFGLGKFLSLSFNTNQNIAGEMWVSDLGNFWDYQIKVTTNPESLTFSSQDWVLNLNEECKVRITEGKILPGAGVTPSGMPADSISYYVEFDDDTFPEQVGFAKYHVSGIRYTGFAGDD